MRLQIVTLLLLSYLPYTLGLIKKCPSTFFPLFQPKSYEYSTSLATLTAVTALWPRKERQSVYGVATLDEDGSYFLQVFERDLNFEPIWTAYYGLDVGVNGVTMDHEQQAFYAIERSQGAFLVKISANGGAEIRNSYYIGLFDCNSIAVTKDKIVAGCYFEDEVSQPGLAIFEKSTLDPVKGIGFQNENSVSVHQLAKDTSYVFYSVFYNAERRNLQEAEGGFVGFQKLDPTKSQTSTTLKRFECSSGCFMSKFSNALELESKEIFTAVTVEGSKLVFITFTQSMTARDIHMPAFENEGSQFVFKMHQQNSTNHIYVLLSLSSPFSRGDFGQMIMVLDQESKHVIDFWNSNHFGLLTMTEIEGMVYFGSYSDINFNAILYKTVLSDFRFLFTIDFFYDLSAVMQEYTGSEYSVNDASKDFMNTTSALLMIPQGEPILTKFNDETETEGSSFSETSEIVFRSAISTAVNSTIGVEHEIPLAEFCNITDSGFEQVYEILIDGEDSGSWATVESGILTVNPPFEQETEVQITVKIGDGNNSFSNFINLVMVQCDVEDCEVCSASDNKVCELCKDNYVLKDDGSECNRKIIRSSRAMGKTVATVTTTSTVASIASSSIATGSTSAAWIMVNQYQLLLTTPTLETGMPEEVLQFMEEFEFFNFNFNFLRGWHFGEIDGVIDSFHFEQPAWGLELIGYESGSIIVNEYNFGKMMFIVFLGNLAVVVVYCVVYKYKDAEVVQKVKGHVANFFMFTLYVRITLEAYFFLTICALSEVVENISDVKEPFSYFIAITTTLLCFSIPPLLLTHYLKYSETEGKFKELYDGFKEKPSCQLYYFFFCSRRLASAVVIVALRTAPVLITLLLFDLIQLLGLLYAIITRPFDAKRDNIMEILNEALFLAFCVIITVLRSENAWSSAFAHLVLAMIMGNGLMIAGILIITFIKDFVVAVSKKCRKEVKEEGEKFGCNEKSGDERSKVSVDDIEGKGPSCSHESQRNVAEHNSESTKHALTGSSKTIARSKTDLPSYNESKFAKNPPRGDSDSISVSVSESEDQ